MALTSLLRRLHGGGRRRGLCLTRKMQEEQHQHQHQAQQPHQQAAAGWCSCGSFVLAHHRPPGDST
ncbi:GL16970 [Drosophila persimilis]|uniref:GL16970 n=1 Tax=Drosophila persimilis TaxID=7234 RepID=B4GHC2_DROPE|nr:GL16970 [Drosophila persimilis]